MLKLVKKAFVPSKVASFIDQEKKQWIDHQLKFDAQTRESNLETLKQISDDREFYLAKIRNSFGGVEYDHWFVTDDQYFIEFGSASISIYSARVNINTNPRNYERPAVRSACKMGIMRERVSHVLGVCNYSLCLRNCEHVANYIVRGRWVSSQMDAQSPLLLKFRNYFMKDTLRLVNTFPSNIKPHFFANNKENKVYSFINDNLVATRMDYYLDYNEDTFNIVVIGPTGAGKSHLINTLFNNKICDSEASLNGVTREIYFIRGRGEVYDLNQKKLITKNILVADTIGLCDTEWDEQEIIELIKGRVSANFRYIDAVYIVFKADRLLQVHVDNINKILDWLKYNEERHVKSHLRFVFVGTHAEFLSDDERNRLKNEFKSKFSINSTTRFSLINGEQFENIIFTGFMPESFLNEQGRARVENDWTNLTRILKLPGISDRINLQPRAKFCSIL